MTSGSIRRMFAVVSASARSAPGSASVLASKGMVSMSSTPYAARVGSMLRSMYGASSDRALGSTWKRWMIHG